MITLLEKGKAPWMVDPVKRRRGLGECLSSIKGNIFKIIVESHFLHLKDPKVGQKTQVSSVCVLRGRIINIQQASH